MKAGVRRHVARTTGFGPSAGPRSGYSFGDIGVAGGEGVGRVLGHEGNRGLRDDRRGRNGDDPTDPHGREPRLGRQVAVRDRIDHSWSGRARPSMGGRRIRIRPRRRRRSEQRRWLPRGGSFTALASTRRRGHGRQVNGFIAPTDHGWYQFLRARPDITEVNFWRPGGTTFRALAPGAPFFFKLKRRTTRSVGSVCSLERRGFRCGVPGTSSARPTGLGTSTNCLFDWTGWSGETAWSRTRPDDRLRRDHRAGVLRARRVGGGAERLVAQHRLRADRGSLARRRTSDVDGVPRAGRRESAMSRWTRRGTPWTLNAPADRC